ncbi:MAG: DUF45 domain-containing protein, partial [Clostridia bacterium]|nr:DUF45 domain-containing protein [Clostridia bacterium]
MYLKKTTETVMIDGHELRVELSPENRRTISLSIGRTRIVGIKYPAWAGKKAAMSFLDKKRDWVSRCLREASDASEKGFGPGLHEGRMLLYKGKPYRVSFGLAVEIQGDGIIVPKETAQGALEDWYRGESEKMVGEFLEKNKARIPRCVI